LIFPHRITDLYLGGRVRQANEGALQMLGQF